MKVVLALAALTCLTACDIFPESEVATVKDAETVKYPNGVQVCTVRYVLDSAPDVIRVSEVRSEQDPWRSFNACTKIKVGEKVTALKSDSGVAIDWRNV